MQPHPWLKPLSRRVGALERDGSWQAFRGFAERYAEQVADALGDEIDALEAAVRAAVPQVQHIDVEPD